MITNEITNNCWLLVQLLERPVLILEAYGEVQVYVCENFKVKGRDFFQNEVMGGQNITPLTSSIEMHQSANNKFSIESRIQNLPKMDFNFGHDNFTLLKMIRKNEY